MVDDKPESTESTAVIRLFLPIWVKPIVIKKVLFEFVHHQFHSNDKAHKSQVHF